MRCEKTVIITGGAGFIGSHVCEALLKRASRVIVIDNFNDFYDPAVKRKSISYIINKFGTDNFVVHEADILDKKEILSIFNKNIDASIIHLAAMAGVRASIDNPELYFDVNVKGTLNILETMKDTDMKNLIFASSSSIYGENKELPFTEGKSDDSPISPYAASKRSGELLCHAYHYMYGLNIACLRFFTVYGPRQREDLAVYKFTKRIMEGIPVDVYGGGDTRRDYTYIEDIVTGVLKTHEWLLERDDVFEIFNLGGGHPVRLNELLSVLEDELGKKAVINRMPAQLGDVSGTEADISKAYKILNYYPETDFYSGIKKFVKWYKNMDMER